MVPSHQPEVDTRSPEERVEGTDVDMRLPVWTAVAAISMIVLVVICVALALDVFGSASTSSFKPGYFKHPLEAPSGPRLHIEPQDELRAVHRREEQKLSGYGWVNRKADIVHIPIERAMQVMVERYRRAHPHKAKHRKRPHPLAAPVKGS